ncbi:hypothetical protein E2C01_034153 [Portunus trituberculatus]|uniref:Uncharacterized protein n=1 Tax=Portunus trituberculatus TaxID=210409 RepID=A0A5B7F228_PORTR|nr:hypothetical protein [Portunus trituberculatus]
MGWGEGRKGRDGSSEFPEGGIRIDGDGGGKGIGVVVGGGGAKQSRNPVVAVPLKSPPPDISGKTYDGEDEGKASQGGHHVISHWHGHLSSSFSRRAEMRGVCLG